MSGARNRWAVAAAAVGVLAAIYVVPLHVPMGAGISEAYMFGFNTRAALVVVACALAGFAVWSKGLGLSLEVEDGGEGEPGRGLLWATLLVSSVAMVGVWWVMRRTGPANEALYFADRYQMFHSGARPYRDFEFAYGPLMFYLPVWVRAVTRMSFTDSYYAACLVEWMAGVVVLWKAVRMTARGRWVYLLVWGFFVVSVADGAPIYGPLRFAGGVLLALVVSRLMRRESALAGFGVAAAGFVLLLSYSPEQGIAFGVGTVLYCAAAVRGKRDVYAGVGLFVAVTATALVAANRFGVLDTLKSYAGGGAALPLVVSPVSLAVLLLMMVAACAAWGTLRDGGRQHPLVYVLLVSACAAPAGFSRCFGAALVGQMLGTVVVGLVVLTRYKWAWRLAACGFLVLVVGVAARDQVRLSRPLLHAALKARAAPRDQAISGEGLPLLAPFGWDQRSFERGRGEVLSGRYAYYQPLLNASVPAEKIAELEANHSSKLLLPMAIGSACGQDDAARRLRLREMLDAIYLPPIVHTVKAGEVLCDYIGANYRLFTEISPAAEYTVWVRR